MSFKMKGFPYNVDNTPVYSTDMDGNILGMAQSNGTILVNKNISPLELKKNKTNMKTIKKMDAGFANQENCKIFWAPKNIIFRGIRRRLWLW